MFAWNEFLLAATLTSFNARTITTGLSEYVTTTGTDWGTMAAIAIITLIPALVIFSRRPAAHRGRPDLRRGEGVRRMDASDRSRRSRRGGAPRRGAANAAASCRSSTNWFDRVFVGIYLFVALELLWMRFLEQSIPLMVCHVLAGRAGRPDRLRGMSWRMHMKALVLEEKLKLSLRDFPIEREEVLGPRDVRIKLHTVGICGSDVHYYTHGGIGVFLVKAPMILGHEASGIVIEAGAEVTTLKVGDRVCMEPGIPDPNSRATRLGIYNVDPAVRFWATPPIHGVLRPTVVHPEQLHLQAAGQRLASPRRRWSSRWPSACMPPPRRRSSRATSRW